MPNPDHPYHSLREACLQHGAVLVVVSKNRTRDEVLPIYEMGQRIFAENRAQDLVEKVTSLPKDIEWHLIGHLQTNKIKLVLPYVHCIQSLDSERLWKKINEEALLAGKSIQCLLQIKIAQEETKFGWSFDQLNAFLKTGKHHLFQHVKITGVMGMATLIDDTDQVRKEMMQLKKYFDVLKENYFRSDPIFKTISMGMSGDYTIALEEGSTMVRIGSLLFT